MKKYLIYFAVTAFIAIIVGAVINSGSKKNTSSSSSSYSSGSSSYSSGKSSYSSGSSSYSSGSSSYSSGKSSGSSSKKGPWHSSNVKNDGTGNGPYPCYGKHNTCSGKTYNYRDLYCDSCDPDGDNVEG